MPSDTNPAVVLPVRATPARVGVGASRGTPRPGGLLLALTVLSMTTVWVILQNNGREVSAPDAVVADYVFVQVPRVSRVVEAVVVGLGALLLWRRYRTPGIDQLVAAVGGLVVIGGAGILRAPGDVQSQLQGIYVYVAPFLIFLWVVAVRPSPGMVRVALGILVAYLVVNVAFMLLAQLPVNVTKSDFNRGFFSDAHALGTWLAVVSCVSFSVYARSLKVIWLLLAVSTLAVSYFPSNEKMILFNLIWAASAAVRQIVVRRAVILATVFVLLTILGGIVAQRFADEQEGFLRLGVLEQYRLSEIGPVVAWRSVWAEFEHDPLAVVVGVGPANFGGVAAGRAFLAEGRAVSEATYRLQAALVTGAGITGAFAVSTNTWSNLMAEFGGLGLLLFLVALLTVAWPILRWTPAREFDARLKAVFVCAMLAVVFQGFVTPYTNWAEPVIVYPAMLFGGYLWRRVRHEAHSYRPVLPGPTA